MLDGMLVGYVPQIEGSEDFDESQIVDAICPYRLRPAHRPAAKPSRPESGPPLTREGGVFRRFPRRLPLPVTRRCAAHLGPFPVQPSSSGTGSRSTSTTPRWSTVPGSRSGSWFAIRIEAANQRPSSSPSIAHCGRADLFDRFADPPGSFSVAHFHPVFKRQRAVGPVLGCRPERRPMDLARRSDHQPGRCGRGNGPGRSMPVTAAELPGLASEVVTTARRFGPAECRSAAECYQLTRDVQSAVQLMIATLRAPDNLDRDRAAPWLGARLTAADREAPGGAARWRGSGCAGGSGRCRVRRPAGRVPGSPGRSTR